MKRTINNKITSNRGFEHLYRFKPHFINLNGHYMHYLDEGSGLPVLMVHGNPTWSFYFRQLVNDLSPLYRVIVPDHIGCGFSDKPGADEYDYKLETRVQDLDALIKSLNLKEKITLIVHDWGGMIASAWALQNLDKIEKIVITNTSGFFLPKTKRFPLRLWLIKNLTFLAIPAVLGFNIFAGSAVFMAAATKLKKDVKTGLTAPYNSWKNRIATLKFVQDIPLSPKDTSYDLVRYVDKNLYKLKNFPMMILWGKKDFVFDITFLDEWKKRFPDARVHLFKNAGHYLFEDKPFETTNLIKNFLVITDLGVWL